MYSDDGGEKQSKGRKKVATITTTTNMARASIPRAVLICLLKSYLPSCLHSSSSTLNFGVQRILH
jgi:hypothetical protein